METVGKTVVFFGACLVVLGLLLMYGHRIPFLGKLPGDIVIRKKHGQIHFPIVTCLLISLLLSFLFFIFKRR